MSRIRICADGKSKDISFETFSKDFPEICKSQQSKKQAMAFALILYQLGDAELIKVLKDEEYWSALNEISGKYLTIFSFHFRKHLEQEVGNDDGDSIGMLMRVEISSLESVHTFICTHFAVGEQPIYPCILLFQVVNGNVSEPLLVPISAATVEQSFNEIRSLLRDVVESLKGVQDEFRGNSEEIFELIKNAIFQRKSWTVIKSLCKKGAALKDFLSLFS